MIIRWKTEKRKIKDLKDYERNPRRITKEAFEKLVDSLKQDGYHARVIIDSGGTIIGGHQRKKALLRAGYKESDEIEVLIPNRELTAEEFDRLNIRDNLPYGEFDFDMLANNFDVAQLVEWGMPEDWLHFGIDEVEISAEDDAVSEVPLEPKTKVGDVYKLRNHRVMCGDSTVATDVEKLLNGSKPILMVTDPPYGVEYKPDWSDGGIKTHRRENAKNKGEVLNDDRADWGEAYSLFPGNIAYVWHSQRFTHLVAENFESLGFQLINLIIWAKHHFVISRGDYHIQHETCWYVVKKGENHNWQGARDQSTLWEIKNNNCAGGAKEETFSHGTQKPIECMLRPILNNSANGAGVYDPFGGSGTTLIACEKSDRTCYMMELSPNYCDVIVARWEKLTGEKAVFEKEPEI